MVYFCVPTIKILKKQAIKKSNNYWMLYKFFLRPLTQKESSVHITVFR
jgi:hypothetical protein